MLPYHYGPAGPQTHDPIKTAMHLGYTFGEFCIGKDLNHPNIVKFEECFGSEETNEIIIIIEYCPCKFLCIIH